MYNNPLTNSSYTNKDFNTIYSELLDIVKDLTYKWDPSISNESDPGVILLKLNAIIGDKNNYNIDKNILEAFPETATQDVSIRSRYKQLGYNMPWYNSAKGVVALKWVNEGNYKLNSNDISSVKIPKFTALCDTDSDYVYTTLEDIYFNYENLTQSVNVIEGLVNTMRINGNENIDLTNLDYHNRLYFDEYNVAENGIFISNSNSGDYWKRVDNLEVQNTSTKCYEFGVDTRSGRCYIQFPDDISTIIGNGINIKYILSNGNNGNITAKTLCKFYEDTTIDFFGTPTVLNTDIVLINNASAIKNGVDPEDAEQAFKNYKKVVGTFDTLITLRDYINAINLSGYTSNSIVCDRTNDIQSCYKVVTDDESSVTDTYNYIQKNNDTVSYIKLDSKPDIVTENTYFIYDNNTHQMSPVTDTSTENWKQWYTPFVTTDNYQMDAFDLRLYVTCNPQIIDTEESYNKTFELYPSNSTEMELVKGYISNNKSLQHNYKDILPNLPCLFNNVFPVAIKVLTNTTLSTDQSKEVIKNIYNTLLKQVNAKQQEFGNEPNYDIIYNAISNCDERIKAIIMDDFVYTTFVTYWDEDELKFKKIPVSDIHSNYVKSYSTDTVELFANEVRKYYRNNSITDNVFMKTLFIYKGTYNDVSNTIWEITTISGNNTIKIDGTKFYLKLYSTLLNDFQKQIIAKNILAGITPLYNEDTNFKCTLAQESKTIQNTETLSTHLVVKPYGKKEQLTKIEKKTQPPVEYMLRDNENIRLLAPSLTTKKEFSNYVKYQLVLNGINHQYKTHSVLDWNENLSEFENVPITIDALESPNNNEYPKSRFNLEAVNVFQNIQSQDNGQTYGSRIVDIKQRNNDGSQVTLFNNDLTLDQILYENPSYSRGNTNSVPCYYYTSGSTPDTIVTYIKLTDLNDIYSSIKGNNKVDYIEFVNNIIVTDIPTSGYVSDAQPIYDANLGSIWKITFNNNSNNYNVGDIVGYHNVRYDYRYTYYKLLKYFSKDINVDSTNIITLNEEDGVDYTTYSYFEVISVSGDITITNITKSEGKVILTFNKSGVCNLTYSFRYDLDGTKVYKQNMWPNNCMVSSNLYISDLTELEQNNWRKGYYEVSYISTLYQLESNGDYMLGDDESLMLFYKDSDEDEAPYVVEKYVKGTIINSTIPLRGVSKLNAVINPDKYSLNDTVIYSDLGNSDYQKIYAMMDYNVLSGTKKISIRDLNQVTINPEDNRLFYFITKNIINSQYTMTFDVIRENSSSKVYGRYILDNDEYFMYLNYGKTEMEIVGAGTVILLALNTDIIEPTITESCNVISYDDIVQNGIMALSDNVIQLNKYKSIIIREQQIYNFNSGTNLIFTLTEAEKQKDSNFITPIFETGKYKDIDGLNIKYSNGGNTSSLPIINLSGLDKANWVCTSVLNINSSYDTPQVIKSDNEQTQSRIIIGNYVNDDSDIVYPHIEDRDKDLYLMTSVQVNKVGGHNVDISYLDIQGRREPVNVYLYTDNITLTQQIGVSTDVNNINLLLSKLEGDTLIINLENIHIDKDIIIPIRNKSNTQKIKVKTVLRDSETENLIIPLNSSVGENYEGIYYYNITNIPNIKELQIQWNNVDVQPNDLFVIYPLFRYDNTVEYLNNTTLSHNDVLETIKTLDYDNKFNYTYTPDSNVVIQQPLLSKEFLNLNHVFNSFTIPMGDMYITNASQSYIKIIR